MQSSHLRWGENDSLVIFSFRHSSSCFTTSCVYIWNCDIFSCLLMWPSGDHVNYPLHCSCPTQALSPIDGRCDPTQMRNYAVLFKWWQPRMLPWQQDEKWILYSICLPQQHLWSCPTLPLTSQLTNYQGVLVLLRLVVYLLTDMLLIKLFKEEMTSNDPLVSLLIGLLVFFIVKHQMKKVSTQHLSQHIASDLCSNRSLMSSPALLGSLWQPTHHLALSLRTEHWPHLSPIQQQEQDQQTSNHRDFLA